MLGIARPYYVCWYMTEKCNLACPYCYAFKGAQDPTLSHLRLVAQSLESQGVRKINLMGGEPLLQPHFFSLIDEYYLKFDLSITTNGTLLTAPNLEYLHGKIERLTVSLDTTSEEIGRVMHGMTYNLNKVIEIIDNISRVGIPLKINTVITNYNLEGLLDLGEFLASLDVCIFWKLFEPTWNANVNCDLNKYKPSLSQIRNALELIRKTFPHMPIDVAHSEELNSNYIIVRSNGDVHIPNYSDYEALCNVISDDLGSALESRGFLFDKNKQIYCTRNPMCQRERGMGHGI